MIDALPVLTEYFNSRPSTRGDAVMIPPIARPSYFNSRPSARGDGDRAASGLGGENFNSRPSARGDPAIAEEGVAVRFISIHAPPRGATRVPKAPSAPHRYFNSRPSARGDAVLAPVPPLAMGFQFTPLREGRRRRMAQEVPAGLHFNSRPSARGDERSSSFCTSTWNFNSRPSARGDGVPTTSIVWCGDISIHAPPRGATRWWSQRRSRPENFNSRPSARGDRLAGAAGERRMAFQFTPLREGRPEQVILSVMLWIFQFTPLREGRLPAEGEEREQSDFNSRPSARGDGKIIELLHLDMEFQFTPLREGRR